MSLLTHSRFLFKPTAPRSWRMPHLWALCGDGAVCPFVRPRLLSFSGGGKTMAGFVGVSYRAGAAFRFICCRRLVRATLCSCRAGTAFRMAFCRHPLRAGVCVWRPWYDCLTAVARFVRRPWYARSTAAVQPSLRAAHRTPAPEYHHVDIRKLRKILSVRKRFRNFAAFSGMRDSQRVPHFL